VTLFFVKSKKSDYTLTNSLKQRKINATISNISLNYRTLNRQLQRIQMNCKLFSDLNELIPTVDKYYSVTIKEHQNKIKPQKAEAAILIRGLISPRNKYI
jgi:hypothetical protein